MLKKYLFLLGVLAFAPIARAANQTFIFSGTMTALTNDTFTNPYNGATITLNGTFNVNNTTYTGTGGGNTLLMSNATDLITLDSSLTGQTPNVQTVVDIQRIISGSGDDFIDMASANFTLPGVTIFGGTGSVTIWTNSADTIVNAGTGNTTILGAAGSDTLNGGNGNDTIDGEGGTNTVASGGGDDTTYGNPGDTINGGVGNDTLILKLTAMQAQNDAADIANAQAFIAANSNTSSSTGPSYTFTSPDLAGLTFSNIESLEVPNAPEPSTLCLSATAIGGMLMRRKHKSRARSVLAE